MTNRLWTLGRAILHAAGRLSRCGASFDAGMQDAWSEAEHLICYALSVPIEESVRHFPRRLTPAQRRAAEKLIRRRMRYRQPAAYLTGEAFFAGLRLFVDRRVLIPRSRIECLFDDPEGFGAWFEPPGPRRILDLCCGSGCLAAALALGFPQARVDGSDISRPALEVARINRRRLKLGGRIHLIHSDLFQNLPRGCYDLIVSNPPYVPDAEWAALPREYHHEPALALRAADNGLAVVGAILQQAADHLAPGGLLVCETGDGSEAALMARWPDFPGEWLQFHFGASGVFAIRRETLRTWWTA